MNISKITETPVVDDDQPQTPSIEQKKEEDHKEKAKDTTPKDTSTTPVVVVVVADETVKSTEKETPTTDTPSLVLKDASTDAELYEFENDDRVVSVRKLDDVVRESKMVLPEEISKDWLVLNLVAREIPTF